MRVRRVYFRRYIPDFIEEENERLCSRYFSQFNEEQMQEDFSDEDFMNYLQSNASEEYLQFYDYESRVGDEGELLDIDGNPLWIFDKDIHGMNTVHEWNENPDGYLETKDGLQLYYSNGERIPKIEIPEFLQNVFEEDE